MPIYEYQCEKCNEITEAFQRFSDKPLKKCPNCSGKLHKIISQSTFHLKGTGWYVTDYAGKTQKSNMKQKSAESTSSSETKSDIKSTKTTGSADD